MPEPGRLDAYAKAGADRCLFTLQYRSAGEALSTLDQWATLIRH